MSMVKFTSFVLFFLVYVRVVAIKHDVKYDANNAGELFKYFKSKYDKKYADQSDEKRAYLNFISSLNHVNALNKLYPQKLYVLNRYADLYPPYIDDRYGVSINACKYI